MPTGLTGGFDMIFGISARTFGAILEGSFRPRIPPGSFVIPNLGNFFYDDFHVIAWPGTTTGNSMDIEFGFFNSRIENGPTFGPLWSVFFVPATIGVSPPVRSAVNLVVTFAFNNTTFDADDESHLAPFTESQIAQAFGLGMAAAGFPDEFPLTQNAIRLEGLQPATEAGEPPAIATLSVAVQRRGGAATPGEEAIAICMNFQDRPDTPPGRTDGDPALVPVSTFNVGQDLLLEIENSFFFEMLASLSLEAERDEEGGGGLGVNPDFVSATRDGISLLGNAQITITIPLGDETEDQAETDDQAEINHDAILTDFTLSPPDPENANTMTLQVSFRTEIDFITYIVSITGATIRLGLSERTIIVGANIPPATVETIVPWWVTVVRILTGAALASLVGPGAVIGGILGGLSVLAETTIVSLIIGPSASNALGGAMAGAGANLIPEALTEMAGGAAFSPPLIFDDLQVGARASFPEVIHVIQKNLAVELASGWSLDLDTGEMFDLSGSSQLPRRTVPVGLDLMWDSTTGLSAKKNIRILPIGSRFTDINYADVAAALKFGGNFNIPKKKIQLVTSSALDAGNLPNGTVLAIRTDRGRAAKAVAWCDEQGRLVLRYVVWDTSAAALRILPVIPNWIKTQTVHDPDTFGRRPDLVSKHDRYAHRVQFNAITKLMTPPLNFRWTLNGMPLDGTGSSAIAGTNITWQQNGATLTLDVALGESLASEFLKCEVSDAKSITASDTIQLTVVGRRDWEEPRDFPGMTQLDTMRLRHLRAVKEAWSAWHEGPIMGGLGPRPPSQPPARLQINETKMEADLRVALVAGNRRLKSLNVKIR
jgi:hypothetical protein